MEEARPREEARPSENQLGQGAKLLKGLAKDQANAPTPEVRTHDRKTAIPAQENGRLSQEGTDCEGELRKYSHRRTKKPSEFKRQVNAPTAEVPTHDQKIAIPV